MAIRKLIVAQAEVCVRHILEMNLEASLSLPIRKVS